MPPEALRPETPSGILLGVRRRTAAAGEVAALRRPRLPDLGRLLRRRAGARAARPRQPTDARRPPGVFAILLLMGGTWLYCRGGARPEEALRALDALVMLGLGALVLIVPSGSIPEPDLRGMVMLLSVNLVLYTRAIFIPSSARRTLAVSATAALPLAVYALATRDRPPLGLEGDVAPRRDHRRHRGVGGDLRAAARGAARAAAGAVHARGEARRGGHGGRLPGPPRHAAAPHGDQAAQAGADGRGGPSALRARGAADGRAQPPQHRDRLRLRPHARRRLLLRDGVPRGPRPRPAGGGGRAPAAGPRRAHPPPGAGGAGRGPRRGARAPRRQAGEHHPVRAGGPLGRREGRGLRPREGARGRRGRHPRRHAGRHPSLPRAGGDPLARRRRAVRPVLARGRGVLPPDRPARVRGPDDHRDLRAPPAHAAHAAFGAARTSVAGRPRGLGPRLPREGPGPAPSLRLRGGGAPRAVRPRRRVEAGARPGPGGWPRAGASPRHRRAEATPSAFTLSRPVVERAG